MERYFTLAVICVTDSDLSFLSDNEVIKAYSEGKGRIKGGGTFYIDILELTEFSRKQNSNSGDFELGDRFIRFITVKEEKVYTVVL